MEYIENIYMDAAASSSGIYPNGFCYLDGFCYLGNPSSQHKFGKESKDVIEKSKNDLICQVFNLENNSPLISDYDIAFTSGGTEADNLAILGMRYNEKKHIITSSIEHKAILESCKELERHYGFEVTYLNPDKMGTISLDDVKTNIKPNTCLVSIMAVNNETGAIQPINEIAQICKEKGILFHTDAVQSNFHFIYSKDIDMISLSGHKFGSQKGVGCLIYKKDIASQIYPIIFGGSQQNGLRSGTENVDGVESMSRCYKYCCKNRSKLEEIALYNRSYILNKLLKKEYNIELNCVTNSCPTIISLYIKGVPADALVSRLSNKNIYISSGSACNSTSFKPSFVLKNMGYSTERALSSVRISIPWNNAYYLEETLDSFCNCFIEAVKELRNIF